MPIIRKREAGKLLFFCIFGGLKVKNRFVPILSLVVIFVAVLACEGGTSGSVMNTSQTCEIIGNRGECQGKLGKLSGTYGKDIEDEGISSFDVIDVELSVTVESGSVKVSIQGPDNEISSAQAGPNQPATLVGVAEGDFDGFEIQFEALDGEAVNVRYNLVYQIR
jgi:hypothetical protein